MGLILPQMVQTKINGSMVKYYENIGYKIPRVYNKETYTTSIPRGAKLNVHVLDLTTSSNQNVKVQCDVCGQVLELAYAKYNKNIKSNDGLYCCKNRKLHTQIQSKEKYELLKQSLENFLNKYNRFPKYNEYTKEYGFNYTYATADNICKLNNIPLKDLYCEIDCFKSLKPSVKYYNKYLTKLLEIINNSDLGTSLYDLSRADNCKNYLLPNIKWFIDNCPDKNVTDISTFKRWAGIYENYLTKEQCEEIILKMSVEYDRPLIYDDFRGRGYGRVSIHMINNYWGSLNKMKKELGLEIVQESMIDKQLTKQETIDQILKICNYVKSQNRDFITTREIDKLHFTSASDTLRRMIRKYFNLSLPDYLKKYNIRIGKEGNGINFTFNDGERTSSQFEYMFSTYLRDYGLKYNNDYFRNVKYKTFINNYNGNMDCDYVVNINNKIIYIEIAGIIEAYKTWYYGDKPITISKSKEKYRIKLKQKEQMFKDNNLIYFILFPCDLTRDIFMQIINNGSLRLKHDIEGFMKNNIDWIQIQNIGELKYKQDEVSCYGQLVVDYDNK